MSDIRLPEGIRPSVSKGYSMTISNNVVRTGMQGGASSGSRHPLRHNPG